MTRPSFELQSHSIHSDGELPAVELVAAAADAGVELLALTDHDSVEGVAEAQTEATRLGLRFVTGVEISVLDPAGADLHVCGYKLDIENEPLRDQLQRSRADRHRRAERMAAALRELGFAVDDELLADRRASGKTIGRPHLAQAVVNHPDNADRLASEGLEEPSAFLVAYLIPGKPGFREREAPTVAEAVELIHGAGGVAIWAHPFWDVAEDQAVLDTIDRFMAVELDGVEVFYVTHTQPQTELLAAYCEEHGLLSTGSSDYHGPGHRQFNRFRAFETYGVSPNLGPIAT